MRKIHRRQQTSNPGGYSCHSRPTELAVCYSDIERERVREREGDVGIVDSAAYCWTVCFYFVYYLLYAWLFLLVRLIKFDARKR